MGTSSLKMHKFRTHVFQFASVNGAPLDTLKRVQTMIQGFASRPGDWVVFPEMWPGGFLLADRLRQEVENAFCFRWLKDFALARKIYLAGSMLEVKRGQFFNTAYLLGPDGRLITRYRKIHLFKLGDEHRKFQAGRKPAIAAFPWGKVGLAICYDLRFPELFRIYAGRGVSLVLVPSAWPRERIDHFLTLLKARAIENQCFVVGANKIGRHDSGIPYGGRSTVWGPWGEKLGALGTRAGILTVELDVKRAYDVRENYPFLKSRVLF